VSLFEKGIIHIIKGGKLVRWLTKLVVAEERRERLVVSSQVVVSLAKP
jgi:hypothetical protein